MIAAFINSIVIITIILVALVVIFQVVMPWVQRTAKEEERFKKAEAIRKQDEAANARHREKAEAELESELGTVGQVLGEEPAPPQDVNTEGDIR